MKLFYLIPVQIKIAFLSQYSQNLKYNLKTLYSLAYYFLKVPLYHKLTRFHRAIVEAQTHREQPHRLQYKLVFRQLHMHVV